MLVVLRHIHPDQLGTGCKHGLHLFKIAGLHYLGKPRYVRSIHKSFQFGPALVAIRPRQYSLCVIQRECGGIRVAFALAQD
jgi:hypothetical protein